MLVVAAGGDEGVLVVGQRNDVERQVGQQDLFAGRRDGPAVGQQEALRRSGRAGSARRRPRLRTSRADARPAVRRVRWVMTACFRKGGGATGTIVAAGRQESKEILVKKRETAARARRATDCCSSPQSGFPLPPPALALQCPLSCPTTGDAAMGSVRVRLSIMMFLEYAVWGVWAPTLSLYLEDSPPSAAISSATRSAGSTWPCRWRTSCRRSWRGSWPTATSRPRNSWLSATSSAERSSFGPPS